MRADPVRSRNAHQKTQTDGRNAQRAVRSHSHLGLSEPKRELLRAMQPFPLFSLFLSTDDLLSSNILLKRDTLRDRLSSPLQRCHRRVHSPERTTPPHHTAHRCTCRWRKTNLPSSPCTPDDKWARDVHNPADPNRETSPGSAGHAGNGGCE